MIELTASQAAILGIVFTIVGALVGALASVYSARLAAEKQQLYAESAKFIAAFATEILTLRKASQDAFRIITDEVVALHNKAAIQFEPWVEKNKLRSFHEAWQQYEQSIKTQSPGSLDRRKAECDAVLSQIQTLLSYAKTRG